MRARVCVCVCVRVHLCVRFSPRTAHVCRCQHSLCGWARARAIDLLSPILSPAVPLPLRALFNLCCYSRSVFVPRQLFLQVDIIIIITCVCVCFLVMFIVLAVHNQSEHGPKMLAAHVCDYFLTTRRVILIRCVCVLH